MKTLDRYRHNVHSQNGEDGVIAEIMRRIGVSDGTCVEFGAWDGIRNSNTFHLVEQGWRAVYIEADSDRFRALQATQARHPRIHAIHDVVRPTGPGRLDALLAACDMEGEFELLSIDIDSDDWQVWHSLTDFSPKVVVIEVNSSLPPGVERINPAGSSLGSSFTSTLRLGRAKGYTLACHTGNMIFVRDDLAGRIGLSQVEIDYPECLFDASWLSAGPARTVRGWAARLARRARRILPG